MNHIKSSVTVAEALQRVFRLSLPIPRYSSLPSKHQLSSGCSLPRYIASSTISRQRPGAARSQFDRSPAPFQSREIDTSQYGPSKPGTLRDEAIRTFRAYLRQPDGMLSESMSYRDILDLRQRDEQGKYIDHVEMLAAQDADRPYPIVQLKNRKQAKEEEKAKKQALRDSKIGKKSVELGWNIGENDLGHRLRRLQEFLGKGAQVEVLIGSRRLRGWKRKSDRSSEGEGRQLVAKIRQAALEVQGAKERSGAQGEILNQMILSFQGPSRKEKDSGSNSAEGS